MSNAWGLANPEKKKIMDRAWKRVNRGKINAAGKIYYQINREKKDAYSKAWAKANPEKRKLTQTRSYQKNLEKVKAASKIWIKNNPEKVRISKAKFYRANSEKVNAESRARQKAHPEKEAARRNLRRRTYGYNMLNIYFPGSIGHHINDVDVVFIPENIHLSCYAGHNKKLHRERAMNLYGNLEKMIQGILSGASR